MYLIILSGLGAGGSHEGSSLDIRPDHRPFRHCESGPVAQARYWRHLGVVEIREHAAGATISHFVSVRVGCINHSAGANARQG